MTVFLFLISTKLDLRSFQETHMKMYAVIMDGHNESVVSKPSLPFEGYCFRHRYTESYLKVLGLKIMSLALKSEYLL